MPLVGSIYFALGVLLWHRPLREHSKVQPIRAQYIEGSGPMRVLHSATTIKYLLIMLLLQIKEYNEENVPIVELIDSSQNETNIGLELVRQGVAAQVGSQ